MSDRPAMIVTGASSGIGRALAERAARAGYDVFAVGRRIERLRELKSAVEFASGALEFAALDLATPHAAKRVVHEAVARFGRIDVLVNCAGGTAAGGILAQSDAQLREQFETHAIVPLALTREALPYLKTARGQVFFFGSGVARIPVGGLGAYPPAKASVRSLARVVRNELRADGIAVTYVDPGAVATEFMTRAGFDGPPAIIAAKPNDVAKRIFEAVKTRRSIVNAVPWQTSIVAFGEFVPNLTDAFLRLAPGIVGTPAKEAAKKPAPVVVASPAPAPSATPPAAVAPPPVAPASPALAESQPVAPQPAAAQPATAPQPAAPEPVAGPLGTLEALAPRMRKLNLSTNFVDSLLVDGRELELGDVAMRWAGMPNKNERNLTRDVLEALAEGGYLAREGNDRYRVTRTAP